MLNSIRSTVLAAVLLLAASPAAAEPFQSFVDLCVSTNADPHTAEVAATGSGWMDVTAEMFADESLPFQDTTAFINFDPAKPDSLAPGETMEILMTGWGDGEAVMQTKGIVLDICGVMSPQADAQLMSKRVEDHLGVPASTDEGETLWLYSRQGDRFVSEAALADADDEGIVAAAGERSLYVVYVFEEDGLSGLFVGAVRSGAKAPDH